MKNIKIFQNLDIEKVRQEATNNLEKVLVENSDKNILLLLSGGSALSLLSQNMQGLNDRLTIGVLDERYSLDPKINNFSQLIETSFYLTAKEKGCKFIDTRINNNETIQDLVNRFEKELKSWKENNPTGLIIITQGMGPDGHTSGIMPRPENDHGRWVVGYDAGNKNQYPLRVTTTLSFLKLVDVSITYIVGKEKANILNKILSEDISPNIFPASIIKEMKKVLLFTDIKT